MKTPLPEGVNLNTILISILLMLCGWTLKTVKEQGEQVATLTAKVQNLERVVFRQE